MVIFAAVVLVVTALWHALATYHFLFFAGRTIRRTTRERPVSPIATEILRFLGAINTVILERENIRTLLDLCRSLNALGD